MVLSKKQLEKLAKYSGVEYNKRMCAASVAQTNRDAEKLAKKLPAHAVRFRAADDTEWQEFGGNGKLIIDFLKAHKKDRRGNRFGGVRYY